MATEGAVECVLLNALATERRMKQQVVAMAGDEWKVTRSTDRECVNVSVRRK